jgi:hypothetical protein
LPPRPPSHNSTKGGVCSACTSDRRDSWLRKLKSGPRRRRYASEHVRTVSPRMSVIRTKTGSKKPWPSSSARGCADWSMATKSLSILGKTAVGNVRLPMKPDRAGTMTHDYKRDDHAVRRSERFRRCPCTCNRVGKKVRHRYEQVDLPSSKAVTLTLGTNGGRDLGEVTGPTKLTLGQQMVVCTPNFAVSPLNLRPAN